MNETTLVIVLIVSPLLDVGALALVLFYPWEKAIESDTIGGKEPCLSVPRLFLGLFVAGAVYLFKLPVLILLKVDVFGLIHITYLDLVVGGPAAGLAILFASSKLGRPRPRIVATPAVRRLALVTMLGIPIGIYSSLVEPFRLQLEHTWVSVAPERAGASSLRIGVLADIQTDAIGRFERDAVDRLMAEKPDMILLPGDFFQGTLDAFERELEDMRDLLGRLQAPDGVFAVLGNTDMDTERVGQMLEGSTVRLLQNEIARVQIGDRELTIAGVNAAWYDEDAKRLIHEVESTTGVTDFRIVLSHYPDVIERLASGSRVDLVVSGHTHGGQICVPGFGPLMTLSRVPRRVAAGGLHDVDGKRVYVSRGLGMERHQAPRIRVFCPPEIAILELETRSPRGH
jgi:predicted MPP superfamily phosphohydrolase